MPGFLLPCLQLAFWPGCLLLCGLMEPPVPFSQAPIWQTKQVQLHLKNIRQKITLQSMSSQCVYTAISVSSH